MKDAAIPSGAEQLPAGSRSVDADLDITSLDAWFKAAATLPPISFGEAQVVVRRNPLACPVIENEKAPENSSPSQADEPIAASASPSAGDAQPPAEQSDPAAAQKLQPSMPGEHDRRPAAPGEHVRPAIASAVNVVPFRAPADAKPPPLTPVERTAFHELARRLTAGLQAANSGSAAHAREDAPASEPDADVPAKFPAVADAPDRSDTIPAASLPSTPREETVEVRELTAILDTVTDGVVLLDPAGRILTSTRRAETLFGYSGHELNGMVFTELLAPQSRDAASALLQQRVSDGAAAVDDEHEVLVQARAGGSIPLCMSIGRIDPAGRKFCAVFRDISRWKKAEAEQREATQQAESASWAKSEFLAKISHEVRTPLNAMIGFSELMMEEKFGPIGNERYRDYLKDIQTSGAHIVSLLNDLLDLAKIEAGKFELTFEKVALNELTRQCVALMQPQAARARVIVRTSLSLLHPQVVADARSLRQIVLNLLSNSIKFTEAGGQVIVSTSLTETDEVVLHVRDTGIGMSEKDLAIALEPFRQLPTSARWGSGGTGLGLPLAKALAESNHARFTIKSAVNAGTLVEIAFPADRVASEQGGGGEESGMRVAAEMR